MANPYRVKMPVRSELASYTRAKSSAQTQQESRQENPLFRPLPDFPIPAPPQGDSGLGLDPDIRQQVQDNAPSWERPDLGTGTGHEGLFSSEVFGRQAKIPLAPSLDRPEGAPSLDSALSSDPYAVPPPPMSFTAKDVEVPKMGDLEERFAAKDAGPISEAEQSGADLRAGMEGMGLDSKNPDALKLYLEYVKMRGGVAKKEATPGEGATAAARSTAAAGASTASAGLSTGRNTREEARNPGLIDLDAARTFSADMTGVGAGERATTEEQTRPGKVRHGELQNEELAQRMLKEKWEIWKIRTGASEAEAAFKLKKAEAGLKAAGAGADPRGALKRKWDEFFGNAAPTKMGDEQRALGQMQDAVPEVIPQPVEGVTTQAMTANQRGARLWLDTVGNRPGADPAKVARARAILGMQ